MIDSESSFDDVSLEDEVEFNPISDILNGGQSCYQGWLNEEQTVIREHQTVTSVFNPVNLNQDACY